MADEKPDHAGRNVLAAGLALFVLLMGAMFAWEELREPDGARAAWLHGSQLVVEEFRYDEGDEVPRIAVLDAVTGKRVESRRPAYRTPFAVVNGRLWLVRREDGYGLEAWSLPKLETALTPDLKLADTSACSDGAVVRVKLTDGRYAVVDLADGKVLAERAVTCGHENPGVASERSGPYSAQRDGASERRLLLRGDVRIGANETFLEPQYVFAGDSGAALEVEGDVFVVHRVELGDNRAMRVSRVGAERVRWTTDLGALGSLERALLAPPSTLVIVGHDGLRALEAGSGKVLWRTGR